MLPEASRPKAGQIGLAFPWHFAFLITKKEERSILISCEYTSKTSNISIMSLGLAELLIALTAVYNIISLLIYLFFSLS
jgi:hypothetical protein